MDEYFEYVMKDVLDGIEGITSRAMFGGYGIYKDGIIFALIAEDELYFKVGSTNRSDYEKLGSHPFVYERKNHKRTTMSYWVLPEDIRTDKEQLKQWIIKSVEISRKSRSKKK